MADNMMCIPNDNKIPSSLDSSDNQLNESTNKNLLKVLKVVRPTNKKTIFKTLTGSCNKQPIPPSLPGKNHIILKKLMRPSKLVN